MNEMMNSVGIQFQRAINDAFSNEVLPKIQNAFKAGSGHVTRKGWDVPTEGPETYIEDYRIDKTRSNSRSEPVRKRLTEDYTDQAYDTWFMRNLHICELFDATFDSMRFLVS